jgi:hypothetical protein
MRKAVILFSMLLITAFVFGQTAEQKLQKQNIPFTKVSATEIQLTIDSNVFPLIYSSLKFVGDTFWMGTLSKDAPVTVTQYRYNLILKKDSQAVFDQNKIFTSGWLAQQATMSDLLVKDQFQFNISGKLIGCTLVSPQIFDGIKFKEGIAFKIYGGKHEVNKGILAEDTTINNIKFPADTKIHYLRDKSALEYVFLSKDTTINSITFPRDDIKGLYFYESGKVRKGLMASDTVIGGKTYKAKWMVLFNEDGTVQKAFDENSKEVAGILTTTTTTAPNTIKDNKKIIEQKDPNSNNKSKFNIPLKQK